jgi:RNA 2',3'-cyclic 3'-phosphodiesterase
MRSNLFFALWPDDETRAAIAAASRALREAASPRGRWIGAHRYHLTLAFLGGFETTGLGAMIERAKTVGDRVDASPFDVSLDVAGSFRNRSIPWWLGSSSNNAKLDALWTALDDALRAERIRAAGEAHVAHVTVLRDADRILPTTVLATLDVAPIRWRADDFVLVESRLGVGARYAIAARWPLRA